MSKTIVISAIALQSGGTLSILQDCLRELSGPAYDGMTIYAIVKSKKFAGEVNPRIQFIEIDGTRSYFHRWYYEYYYFKKLSKTLNPDLWFSLHDITPNVEAKKQVVYCHNPSAFYSISLSEFFIDPKFGLFTWLYWILYRINIHRNTWVVVQQDWMRAEFNKLFSVPREEIIVAHPDVVFSPRPQDNSSGGLPVFFYPSFPRVFKNIEVIGDAVALLEQRGVKNFEVVLTINGTENRYARMIHRKYGHLSEIKWKGHVTRTEVFGIYGRADCLIFPSRLETWGLPVSEFKQTGKPILLADKPYAHETGGNYPHLTFFNPRDGEDLAARMEEVINGRLKSNGPSQIPVIQEPMANNWAELFRIILSL